MYLYITGQIQRYLNSLFMQHCLFYNLNNRILFWFCSRDVIIKISTKWTLYPQLWGFLERLARSCHIIQVTRAMYVRFYFFNKHRYSVIYRQAFASWTYPYSPSCGLSVNLWHHGDDNWSAAHDYDQHHRRRLHRITCEPR